MVQDDGSRETRRTTPCTTKTWNNQRRTDEDSPIPSSNQSQGMKSNQDRRGNLEYTNPDILLWREHPNHQNRRKRKNRCWNFRDTTSFLLLAQNPDFTTLVFWCRWQVYKVNSNLLRRRDTPGLPFTIRCMSIVLSHCLFRIFKRKTSSRTNNTCQGQLLHFLAEETMLWYKYKITYVRITLGKITTDINWIQEHSICRLCHSF